MTTSIAHQIYQVSDTGVGVPEDKLHVLTIPFVRVQTDPHMSQEGTGLGLAIVQSMVDLHNGELTIESDFGKGTVVRVKLPSAEI